MYDYVFEKAATAVYAMYAFAGLVCFSLLYLFSQMASRCIYGSKKGTAGIEAFTYVEDPLAEKNGAVDTERVDSSAVAEESTQEYHNLAGSRRSAAPAIF